MNPRLLAISGSLKGRFFPLSGDEISIGRDRNNDIRVNDRSISRRHCLIKQDGEIFSINDFESFNGTFVNDTAVKQHGIKHGDRIMLGDVLFLFFQFETDNDSVFDLIELSSEINGGSTVRIENADAVYLNPLKLLKTLKPDNATARNLSALLELNIELGKLRDLESLQKSVLKAVFDALPVERGAIILIEENLENITGTFTKNRTNETAPKILISRTIAEQVIREKAAILCRDIETDPLYKQAESLIVLKTNSLICVPLSVGGKLPE